MNGDDWGILVGVLVIILFIGLIVLLVYNDIQKDKDLCENICAKKGHESLGYKGGNWNKDEECKCLTDGGDIKYYPAG